MSDEMVTYLDSSAIVKLVVAEAESNALRNALTSRTTLVASALVRTEVLRAVGPHAQQQAVRVLESVEQAKITDAILDRAGRIAQDDLRSLDAIHLAAAEAFGVSLGDVITYDRRMARAAEAMGMSVLAPG